MVMGFSGAERNVSRRVRGQLLEVTWSGFEWVGLGDHYGVNWLQNFMSFCLTCSSEKGRQEMVK